MGYLVEVEITADARKAAAAVDRINKSLKGLSNVEIRINGLEDLTTQVNNLNAAVTGASNAGVNISRGLKSASKAANFSTPTSSLNSFNTSLGQTSALIDQQNQAFTKWASSLQVAGQATNAATSGQKGFGVVIPQATKNLNKQILTLNKTVAATNNYNQQIAKAAKTKFVPGAANNVASWNANIKQASTSMQSFTGKIMSGNRAMKAQQGDIRGLVTGMLAYRAVAMSFGVFLGGINSMIDGLVEYGGELENVTLGMQNLQRTTDIALSSTAEGMKKASLGTLTYADSIKAVNEALLLGGEPLASSMPDLFEVARANARAMGVDVDYALNSIVIGLGRVSPRWLDNLGIIIDTRQVYKEFAAEQNIMVSQMTEEHKRIALINAILDKYGEITGDASMKTRSMSEALQYLQTSWVDFLASVGEDGMNSVFQKLFEFGGDALNAINLHDSNQLIALYKEIQTEGDLARARWKETGDLNALKEVQRTEELMEQLGVQMETVQGGTEEWAEGLKEVREEFEEIQKLYSIQPEGHERVRYEDEAREAEDVKKSYEELAKVQDSLYAQLTRNADMFIDDQETFLALWEEVMNLEPPPANLSDAERVLWVAEHTAPAQEHVAEATKKVNEELKYSKRELDAINSKMAIWDRKMRELAGDANKAADALAEVHALYTRTGTDTMLSGSQTASSIFDDAATRVTQEGMDALVLDYQRVLDEIKKINEGSGGWEEKLYRTNILVADFRDRWKDTTAEVERYNSQAQTAMDDFKSFVASGITAGLEVKPWDFLDGYQDAPLEKVRQMMTVANEGTSSEFFKQFFDSGDIPPEVVAQGEEAVKLYAQKMAEAGKNMLKPDWLDTEALVRTLKEQIENEKLQEQTIQKGVDAALAAGLFPTKEAAEEAVKQTMGIPSSKGFTDGITSGLQDNDIGLKVSATLKDSIIKNEKAFEDAGKTMAEKMWKGLKEWIEDQTLVVPTTLAGCSSSISEDGSKP